MILLWLLGLGALYVALVLAAPDRKEGGMNYIADLEHDLMCYCLKQKGKWWANHFFRNREVNELYAELRGLDVGTVIAIVTSGDANYQKHIDFYQDTVKPNENIEERNEEQARFEDLIGKALREGGYAAPLNKRELDTLFESLQIEQPSDEFIRKVSKEVCDQERHIMRISPEAAARLKCSEGNVGEDENLTFVTCPLCHGRGRVSKDEL